MYDFNTSLENIISPVPVILYHAPVQDLRWTIQIRPKSLFFPKIPTGKNIPGNMFPIHLTPHTNDFCTKQWDQHSFNNITDTHYT